jgi:hypothetical protein
MTATTMMGARRRKRAARAAIVVAALLAAGCTAILGDFNTGPPPGNSGDDGGLSPEGSVGIDSTNPPEGSNAVEAGGATEAGDSGDATGTDAGDASNTRDAGRDGDATHPPVDGGASCSPQMMRCMGNSVQTCDPNGAWAPATPCPSATPFCNGAGVCGVCADTTTQCSAGGGVETCSAGAWLPAMPCMNQACSMGVCTGMCLPNTSQCSGNGVQKCDTTGHWAPPTACVKQTCVFPPGACQGVCAPGDTTCSPGGVQKCDPTGVWGPATACGPHQSCTGGGSAGQAVCKCNTDPTCSATGPTCSGATTLSVCAQDSQACWYASSSSMCTNGACFGSAGNAQCCTNACTNGATRCGGAGVQTCQVQGNGCTAWNAGTACGPHQNCTPGAGSATCTCKVDPVCSTTGTVCSDATTTATCAQDTQGCFYASGTMACGPNKNCASGSCVCNSGYTACGTNCVNVNNDNNNCGTCNFVCPVLSSPSFGTTCGAITPGKCAGYIGGYVSAGGGTLLSNPDAGSIFAVRAQMPASQGTFVGIGATVGSNDPSPNTTQMIFALYSDNAGAPGTHLFQTDPADPNLSFPDPSPLFTLRSSTAGSYYTPFNGTLAANTTYWVYMKAGTNGSTVNTAGISSSSCAGAHWINVDPPQMFFAQGPTTCPGDFQLYMIVNFP